MLQFHLETLPGFSYNNSRIGREGRRDVLLLVLKIILKIVWKLALALLLVLLGAGLWVFVSNFVREKPGKKKPLHKEVDFTRGMDWQAVVDQIHRETDAALACPHEDVTVISYDGLKLHALYFPLEGAERTVIAFHGFKSSAFNDFAISFPFYRTKGCNLLLVDQRAHGKSEGRYITFGVRERYDCLKWTEYIASHTPEGHKIYLAGVSMGAATVEMAANLGLPDKVAGILGDCAFTSPYNIVRDVGDKLVKFGVKPILCFTGLFCRMCAGFSLKGASTTEALKHAPVPVLIIHGDSDRFVPYRMGLENFAACAEPKRMFTAHGADHALSFLCDRQGYTRAVDDFLALAERAAETRNPGKPL